MLSEAGGGVETSLGQTFVDGGVAKPCEENSPVRNRSSALIPRSSTPGPYRSSTSPDRSKPLIPASFPLETADDRARHCTHGVSSSAGTLTPTLRRRRQRTRASAFAKGARVARRLVPPAV